MLPLNWTDDPEVNGIVSTPPETSGHARRQDSHSSRGGVVAQQRRGLGKGLGALIPETHRPGVGMNRGSTTGTRIPASVGPGDYEHAKGGQGITAESITDTALRPVAGAYFEEVAVDSITPNPRQPRRAFDDESLDELAASITEVGLLQPVVVRGLGGGPRL